MDGFAFTAAENLEGDWTPALLPILFDSLDILAKEESLFFNILSLALVILCRALISFLLSFSIFLFCIYTKQTHNHSRNTEIRNCEVFEPFGYKFSCISRTFFSTIRRTESTGEFSFSSSASVSDILFSIGFVFLNFSCPSHAGRGGGKLLWFNFLFGT